MATHILKRTGRRERFNHRKVYRSCYDACRSSHLEHKRAEEICRRVTDAAKKWIKAKKEVTSDQIFRFVLSELKRHDKEVAFMYETHRDIS